MPFMEKSKLRKTTKALKTNRFMSNLICKRCLHLSPMTSKYSSSSDQQTSSLQGKLILWPPMTCRAVPPKTMFRWKRSGKRAYPLRSTPNSPILSIFAYLQARGISDTFDKNKHPTGPWLRSWWLPTTNSAVVPGKSLWIAVSCLNFELI